MDRYAQLRPKEKWMIPEAAKNIKACQLKCDNVDISPVISNTSRKKRGPIKTLVSTAKVELASRTPLRVNKAFTPNTAANPRLSMIPITWKLWHI